jgi:hypothetical protein
MTEFQQFRLWIIIILGSASALILGTIWQYYYYKRRKVDEQPDYGLLFLSAGLVVWVLSSILGLSNGLLGIKTDQNVRHAFSMINNGLIACSFPFFEYSAISDRNIKVRKYWKAVTLSLTLFVLILIFAFGQGDNKQVGNLLDFLSTSLILIVLTGILFKTFDKRKLKPVGYLSIAVTVTMLISQFLISFKDADFLECQNHFLKDMGYVMSGISFVLFVFILLILAFTWILDESSVYDEWKEQETIGQVFKKDPGKALKYLASTISNGLSKYDLEAFNIFFDALPPEVLDQSEFKKIHQEYIAYSGRLHNALNNFLQNLIDFTTYEQNCSIVRVGLLDIIERLRGLLPPNQDNPNG